VLLDPIHFCGGKTSYEAFSLGVPVVTKPSSFLRGRITYALYRVLGIMDAVAHSNEQYVDIALRLANDPALRADLGQRILAACPRLFNDRPALAELEDFLERAVREKRAGSGGQSVV
jgi:predicted O-linked N-acetylglucosamine transferase (SPINDLY family)